MVYAFVKTPIYEIQSNMSIGYINNNSNSNSDSNSKIYILDPNFVKIYIKNNYDFSQTKQQFPKVDVEIVKKTKNILNLKVDYFSNESSLKYLNKIISDIKLQEDKKIKFFIDSTKNQITILKNTKNNFVNQINNLQAKLKTTTNPQIYAIILKSIQDYQKQILDIDIKINQSKNIISPVNINKIKLIGEVKTEDTPIKPKKKLIVIVSFITGLILAIFLVFFREFLKDLKDSEDENQNKE